MDDLLTQYRDRALEAIKEILEEELRSDLQSMDIKISITPYRVIARCEKQVTKVKTWRNEND